MLSKKSNDSCVYLNHSWLAVVLYHTAEFQKKYLDLLPKKDIFGGIPFNIFDIIIMSHHHTKFKKILRVDSKNKAIKFFGLKLR